MTKLLFSAAALAAAVLSPASAQQRSQTPSVPTFRANVNAILVDVRVVDRQGQFVRDLRAHDFRVFEDDVEQRVATFGLVDLPAAPASPPTVAGIHVEPDVATNARSVEGRLYVIVMDDKVNVLSSEPVADAPARLNPETYRLRGQAYRALAREFVEQHLTPGDRAALVSISGRKDMAQEFTNNRERLLASIGKFEMGYGQEAISFDYNRLSPGAATDQGRAAERLDTTRAAMAALRALAAYLAQIPSRRKAIVFFRERMGDSFSTSNFNLGLNTDEAQDFRNLIQATSRANVSIYVVDPIGVPTGKGARGAFIDDAADGALRDSPSFDSLRREGLRSLAEATGGFALTGSNEYRAGFQRVVDENSSYYLLGYSPSNANADGKFRRLGVEVNRPGVTVRTRTGYFGREQAAARPTLFAGVSAGLNDVLRSPLPVPGLTMSVSAAAFRGAGSEAAVSVIVEARGNDLQFAANATRFAGGMELALIVTDADGRIRASERGSMTMNLSRSTHHAIAGGGIRVLSRLKLKPGRYQLRVAAEDRLRGATRGTVFYDLDVPDFAKGNFGISGSALASAVASQMPTTGSDRHWPEVLETLPTTQREFSAGDRLRSYFEVYVNDRKTTGISVSATIRNEAGVRVSRSEQTFSGGPGGDQRVTHRVVTPIELKDFKPGQYLLTVETETVGPTRTSAVRHVGFTVR